MKTLVYLETVDNVTYSLFAKTLKDTISYDIEVTSKYTTEYFSSISTDCQTALLLLELLIRKEVSPSDLNVTLV